MSEQSSTPDEAQPESFVSHLIELRDRLLRSVIVVLIVFIPAAIFSGKLFTLLAAPMLSALSTEGVMISTESGHRIFSPVPLKFAFCPVSCHSNSLPAISNLVIHCPGFI